MSDFNLVHEASYLIPGYGTYLSIKDAVNEPTAANIGSAALSALGDASLVFGVGAGIKGLSAINRSRKLANASLKAVDAASKSSINAFNTVRSATNIANKYINKASKSTNNTLDYINKAKAKYYSEHAKSAANSANKYEDLYQQTLANNERVFNNLINNSNSYKQSRPFLFGIISETGAKTGATQIKQHKQGSKIHIKKENRGKFTDYCGGKVTQNCINKAKKSGNKKLVKRAVFAENARKWKHQNGGIIKAQMGLQLMPYTNGVFQNKNDAKDVVNTLKPLMYFNPVMAPIATGIDVVNAIKNPTKENIVNASVSIIPGITHSKAIKTASKYVPEETYNELMDLTKNLPKWVYRNLTEKQADYVISLLKKQKDNIIKYNKHSSKDSYIKEIDDRISTLKTIKD